LPSSLRQSTNFAQLRGTAPSLLLIGASGISIDLLAPAPGSSLLWLVWFTMTEIESLPPHVQRRPNVTMRDVVGEFAEQ
jgi:hypothetical protein